MLESCKIFHKRLWYMSRPFFGAAAVAAGLDCIVAAGLCIGDSTALKLEYAEPFGEANGGGAIEKEDVVCAAGR